MPYTFLADVVVLVHLLFVAFLLFGGVLVWRWTRLGWIHVHPPWSGGTDRLDRRHLPAIALRELAQKGGRSLRVLD